MHHYPRKSPEHLGSPNSSNGESSQQAETPNTSFHSPEDVRPSRHSIASFSGGGVRLVNGSSSPDPFISTQKQHQLRGGASVFVSASTKALLAHINAHPLINEAIDSTTILMGVFTTDGKTTRNIKVSRILPDPHDRDLDEQVEGGLFALSLKQHKLFGTVRKEVVGDIVLVRCTDRRDAIAVWEAIRDQDKHILCEFIAPRVFKEAASPSSQRYSAHEGQVMLTAKYPIQASFDRTSFENSLRKLLSPDNDLCAWQKIMATEAGTFKMLAEFFDAEVAVNRAKHLDGKIVPVGSTMIDGIEVTQHVVVIVKMHEPDLVRDDTETPRGRSPFYGTPTHSTGSNTLEDAFSRLEMDSTFRGYGSASSAAGLTYVVPHGPMMPAMGYGQSVMGMAGYQPVYASAPSPMMGNGMNGMAFPIGGFEQGMDSMHHGYSDYAGYGGSNHGSPFGSGSSIYTPSYSPGYTSSLSHLASPRHNGGADSREFMPIRPAAREYSIQIPRPKNRQMSALASHHNHVDVDRIRHGIDVRTTVMLRNIPNKLNQAQLKDIVDSSSFGYYDFMYLRIDFSNNCNVGYAFINFTDPLDIIAFVNARSNKKWTQSDKIAEVSYATIQGKDCLVQKFRNSSVMLEPPHHRPKLFYTMHGPYDLIGTEEPFPPSDNASKLKRSCENAEHVGLFAPSAGQHMRDEQRRRRSQYDRGTSLAEREEFGDYGEFDYVAPYPQYVQALGYGHQTF